MTKLFQAALGLASAIMIQVFPACAEPQDVALEAQRDGVVRALSITTPEISQTTGGRFVWEKEIEQIGSNYLRLRINNVKAQNAEGVFLSIWDRGGRRIHKYPAIELAAKVPFWTDVIPGDYVLVSLNAEQAPEGFGLSIDRLAYQTFAGAALSTVGEDEKQHIAEYANDELITRLQRPIARLLFIKGDTASTCTGFLIKPGRLMTNHHCVNTQEVCNTTRVIFGYQHDKNGLLQFGDQYECNKFLEGQSNYELDFALLEIDGNPGQDWGTVTLSTSDDPKAGKGLFIIQHPAGQPKQITKTNCAAGEVPVDGRASGSDFTHTCDTVGGSSGSPVFDEFGTIVGLHHYGFNEGGSWTENRAIRIRRIVDHLGE